MAVTFEYHLTIFMDSSPNIENITRKIKGGGFIRFKNDLYTSHQNKYSKRANHKLMT